MPEARRDPRLFVHYWGGGERAGLLTETRSLTAVSLPRRPSESGAESRSRDPLHAREVAIRGRARPSGRDPIVRFPPSDDTGRAPWPPPSPIHGNPFGHTAEDGCA